MIVGKNPIRLKDDREFRRRGLKNISDISFQNRNLLIGKNGAGKSRFLYALRDTYNANQGDSKTTIMLDFPAVHLSPQTTPGQENTDLFSMLFSRENISSISNFLDLAAQDYVAFFNDMIVTLKEFKSRPLQKKMADGFAEINNVIQQLLNCTIEVNDSENRPVLYFRKMDVDGKTVRVKPYQEMISEFSPGELLIFYVCFFLFYLGVVQERKLVIFMDEPELHLHPQALILIMNWLLHSSAINELWVASHSLFLVPMFSFSEIALFEDNAIIPRDGKMYKHLYDNLVGLTNIDIFEMLKSIEGWQYYEFIVECFCLPISISNANPKDEQFRKMVSKLQEKSTKPLRILDYGAGKFRIWECYQNAINNGSLNDTCFCYEAFEPYPDEERVRYYCLNTANAAFQFFDRKEKLPKAAYDAIILMNVLHEIEVTSWIETLHTIRNALKSDGVLIFLEVESLSLGEQPYGNTGYLVLGDQEVKKLFCDEGEIISKKMPEEKSNCWAIPWELLNRVSTTSVRTCIELLLKNSKQSLKEQFENRIAFAHKENKDYEKKSLARKYAFVSQQFINSTFALELIDKRINQMRPSKKKNDEKQEKLAFPGVKD